MNIKKLKYQTVNERFKSNSKGNHMAIHGTFAYHKKVQKIELKDDEGNPTGKYRFIEHYVPKVYKDQSRNNKSRFKL